MNLAIKKEYNCEFREKVEIQFKKKIESTFFWIVLIYRMFEDISRRRIIIEFEKFLFELQFLYERIM
jgi:hypothetical protein